MVLRRAVLWSKASATTKAGNRRNHATKPLSPPKSHNGVSENCAWITDLALPIRPCLAGTSARCRFVWCWLPAHVLIEIGVLACDGGEAEMCVDEIQGAWLDAAWMVQRVRQSQG